MNRKLWSVRRLAPLGVLALVAGAAGAQAAGGGSPAPTPAAPRAMSPAAPVEPARLSLLPSPAPYMALSPPARRAMPVTCRPPGKPPAADPPSEALKDAFGILRRDRTDDDALPERALAALKARGLKVVDPGSTRLLRADRRARAWVVPVPDVNAASTVVCRGPRGRAFPATAPREGLAVVSVGGAPAGGGGALRDLQRGLASATIDACAGSSREMLGVSGIVPDGVEAVFVTAADGSATRADVHDNGYAFVLPRPRRPEPRYVVWTGTNGTPHVQPLPAFFVSGRGGACRRLDELVRVTPDPWGAGCASAIPSALLAARPPRVLRSARPRPRPSRIVRPGRAGRARARPAPPIAPAPFPLLPALDMCGGGPLPILLSSPVPALVAPRAMPPRMRAVPPRPRPRARRGRGAPRVVRVPRAAPATPRAPRAAPAPSVAPTPVPARPAPPRGP